MTTKFGFSKMTIAEFDFWIKALRVGRTILSIQQHHTLIPSYSDFKGINQFDMQQSMKNYHVYSNGWSDIGQHFSTYPDGTIVTGRSLESSPACIYGQNAHSICIENVGNFDKGKNTMTDAQRDTIIRMTALLCQKFNLPVNTKSIVYHHWFDLSTGERNNGTRNNKSCPGTAFFGGNKVADCEANFLPLVAQLVTPAATSTTAVTKYVTVTASSLNVRKGPGTSYGKADRDPAMLGAILRVYKESDNWLKISNSQEHWVSAKYTQSVDQMVVTASTLNARSGPGTSFEKIGKFSKGEEVFIEKVENNWAKVCFEPKWLSKDYLSSEL